MFVVAVITGISAYSAMVSIVVKNLHGQLALSRNEALRASLKLFWPVLGSIVLAYLVVGVGCMVFLIPGIFFFVALFVYLPIVIIDRKGPLEGFGESVRLTWGNWWRTFGVLSFAMICYGIGYALVAVIVVGLPNLLTHFVHPLMNAYLLDIVNLIIGTVFMPWFAALALVLLNDFKVRQTG
jgi:hypothetical protein